MKASQSFGILFALMVASVSLPSSLEARGFRFTPELESLIHQQKAAWNQSTRRSWDGMKKDLEGAGIKV